MNYKKQADDFCKKYDTKIIIKKSKSQTAPPWQAEENDERGVKHDITIERGHKSYSFNFWDSIYNKRNGIDSLNNYDILTIITKYNPNSFKDFCNEFDYKKHDDDYNVNKKSKGIYKVVLKEWKGLENIFGDCLDELREIN